MNTATEKQINYITDLLKRDMHPALKRIYAQINPAELDTNTASRFIGDLKSHRYGDGRYEYAENGELDALTLDQLESDVERAEAGRNVNTGVGAALKANPAALAEARKVVDEQIELVSL